MLESWATGDVIPGRGGRTEVTSDQTIFERTHVLGALKLHGLEKVSSALLSGQWSGICLMRGGFERTFVWTMIWNLSDERWLRAHFCLDNGLEFV